MRLEGVSEVQASVAREKRNFLTPVSFDAYLFR